MNNSQLSTHNSPLIPPGYKQTEVGVIPEDWDVRPLGSLIVSLEAGVSVNSIDKDKEVSAHGMSILKTSCVIGGKFLPEERKTIVAHDLQRAKLNPRKDTIVFSRMNTPALVGECGYVDLDYPSLFLPDRLWMTRHDDRTPHCVRWLAYLLSSRSFNRVIKESATGTSGSMKNISKGSLLAVRIPLPPTLAEQEAIAEALSDADALIESLEQLLTKKRLLKQGAMQELLTGKKRLPGFEINPGYKQTEVGVIPEDWRVESIEQISTVGRGRVISHREIGRSLNPRYPVYSSQTSNNGVMGYLDTFEFEGEYITWTTDGANAGTVFARNGRFNCTNVCGTIKLKSDNHLFVAKVLGKIAPRHVSRHLGNPKLMNDVMKRVKISLPATLVEQTAIAATLSDMDAEIAALEAKLVKARQLKQGMMQELLAGRIRLV